MPFAGQILNYSKWELEMVQFKISQALVFTILLSLLVNLQAMAITGGPDNNLSSKGIVTHNQTSKSAKNLNLQIKGQKQKTKMLKVKKSASLRRTNDQLKRMSTRTAFHNRPRFKEWKR